jgi:thiaminase
MPFNWELGEGTLATGRFRQDMIQYAHYLDGFARALFLASAKGSMQITWCISSGRRRLPTASSDRFMRTISRHSEFRQAISPPPNPRLSAITTLAAYFASPHSNRLR